MTRKTAKNTLVRSPGRPSRNALTFLYFLLGKKLRFQKSNASKYLKLTYTAPSVIAHIIFRPIHYFKFELLFPGKFRSLTSLFVTQG